MSHNKTNGTVSVEDLIVSEDEETPPVKISTLFRYATKGDQVLIAVGIVAAILSGIMIPLLTVVFGSLLDEFIDFKPSSNGSSCSTNTSFLFHLPYILQDNATENSSGNVYEFRRKAFTASGVIMAMGAVYFATVATFVWTFNYVAVQQSFRIRQEFIRAILGQKMSWIDSSSSSSGSFATSLLSDLVKIENGIGEPIGNIINYLTVIICKITVSLYLSWKLTLILLSLTPLIIASIGLVQWSSSYYSSKESEIKRALGSICQECFSMIKTVTAFNGQQAEIIRFDLRLSRIKEILVKASLFGGLGIGFFHFFTNATYALGIYLGTKFMIEDAEMSSSSGNIMVVFWNVAVISMMVVTLMPNLDMFQEAKLGAKPIFSVIDRGFKTELSRANDKIKLEQQISSLEVRNVTFSYPSRPDVNVLRNVSLSANIGETIALVGPSGSGKSCLLELLQQFYDVNEGRIQVSDQDIESFDPKSLRNEISVVGQEPVLFEGTIAENILMGDIYSRCDADADSNANMQQITDVARRANAHDFIIELPQGYQTILTDKVQLSGGQKQRIAIARALMKRASLLLLDEATSALDLQSESLVRATLESEIKSNRNRITIIVAHKLSEVKDADRIFVFKHGSVVESGTHEELINLRGLYAEMFEIQDAKSFDDGNSSPRKHEETLGSPTSFMRRSARASKRSLRKIKSNDEEIIPAEAVNSTNNHGLKKLFKILLNCKFSLIFGIISSIVSGFWIPFYAVLIGDFTSALALDNEQKLLVAFALTIKFIIAGSIIMIACLLTGYFFGKVASSLSYELRLSEFKSMISKPIPWFEESENNVGAIIVKIISNIDSVTDYVTEKFPSSVHYATALIACLILAVYQSWKLTLVISLLIPMVFILAYLESKMNKCESKTGIEITVLEDMVRLTIQIVESFKTIASFNLQEHFITKNDTLLKSWKEINMTQAKKQAFISAGAKASLPVIFSVTFFVGSYLISTGDLKYEELMKITEGVLLASFIVAEDSITSFELKGIKSVFLSLVQVTDLLPCLEAITSCETIPIISGPIKINSVDFRYPSRPEIKVLDNLNLQIETGTKIGIVGASGCGKSTISQLLLKYYNPSSGSIQFNGCDSRQIDDHSLRSVIAIVNQEPSLFTSTIFENITYGCLEEKTDTVMERVVAAATRANIHATIMQLSHGYETVVGDRGSLLSGGQKQRIALARALFRDPKIFIFDEATSALDAISKEHVEGAITNLPCDKTVISISHDIKSLENYDEIYFMSNGHITRKSSKQNRSSQLLDVTKM